MVCISLQLAEKPSAAGVLNDQEGRSAGSAHRQAKHGAIDPELLNDAVDFGANGVMERVWRARVIGWSATIDRFMLADLDDQHQQNLIPPCCTADAARLCARGRSHRWIADGSHWDGVASH